MQWRVIEEYTLHLPGPPHVSTHKHRSQTHTTQHILGWRVCGTHSIERLCSRGNHGSETTRLELQPRLMVTCLDFSSLPFVAAAQKNQIEISSWKRITVCSSCWSCGMASHYIILFKLIWANKYKCACVLAVLKHFNV